MKRLKGSYTIEAVYIMGITLFSFATVVGAAFRLKERTVTAMELHTRVEILRYQADTAGTVEEHIAGPDWYLEIKAPVPAQEDWLRMISLADR